MRVLLALPPLTQLNTPYPSTAYLAGHLRADGYDVAQVDLGLELVLRLFSAAGIAAVFDEVERRIDEGTVPYDSEFERFLGQRGRYERTVDPVVRFLQGRDSTLATRIAGRRFLPEGRRFADAEDLDWAFGALGVADRARLLATRYLDDLSDLIRAGVDPHFGFTRYAASIAEAAASYDPIADALEAEPTLVARTLIAAFDDAVEAFAPDVVGFSVPFPGNLLGALICGRHLGRTRPQTVRVLGGGYPNTELRSLDEPRLFDAVDHVTLDDGERPFSALLRHLSDGGQTPLVRTFTRRGGAVVYSGDPAGAEPRHRDLPAPDYDGLRLDAYLSVLAMPNPMHRLWSDGRWNKLTIAHGCYWKKCSFCDVTLDYIERYDPAPAATLVDRIEAVVSQTGESGFHFVDEAAPPAGLRDLALELLARGTTVSWWTNIRFESAFTPDLCRLLVAAGCIAVSGGLEVASDRLLERMRKGVSVAQVARVAGAFTDAGALVHAYLMYGFPTQTEAETVDALERVRQLFDAGVVRSGFWHRFAMTVHSPVGRDPAAFGVRAVPLPDRAFARNEQAFVDESGVDHEALGHALSTALYNYMLGAGLDLPVERWFSEAGVDVRGEGVDPRFVTRALAERGPSDGERDRARLVWLGERADWLSDPETGDITGLSVIGQHEPLALEMDAASAEWFAELLDAATPAARHFPRLRDALASAPDGRDVLDSDAWRALRAAGLLLV